MGIEHQLKKLNFLTIFLVVITGFTVIFTVIGIFSLWKMNMINAAIIFKIFVTVTVGIYLIWGLIQAKKDIDRSALPLGWAYLLYIVFRVFQLIVGLFQTESTEAPLPAAMKVGAIVASVVIAIILTLPAVMALWTLRKTKEGENDEAI